VKGNRVRVAIEAPDDTPILRADLTAFKEDELGLTLEETPA
jgi:sRNA-binding carbon storage regulator CsrA